MKSCEIYLLAPIFVFLYLLFWGLGHTSSLLDQDKELCANFFLGSSKCLWMLLKS